MHENPTQKNNSPPKGGEGNYLFWLVGQIFARRIIFVGIKNMKHSKKHILPPPPFCILIDSNEQHPLPFPRELSTRREKIYPGDYSVDGLRGVIAVERKSLSDLVGTLFGKSKNADGSSIRRIDKFCEELMAMKGEVKRGFVLVEEPRSRLEAHYYESSVPPSSVMGIISDIEIRTGIEFKFFENRRQAASWLAIRLLQEWKMAHGLSSFRCRLRPQRLHRKTVEKPLPPPPKPTTRI